MSAFSTNKLATIGSSAVSGHELPGHTAHDPTKTTSLGRVGSFLDIPYAVLNFPLEILGVFRFLNWADTVLAREWAKSHSSPAAAGRPVTADLLIGRISPTDAERGAGFIHKTGIKSGIESTQSTSCFASRLPQHRCGDVAKLFHCHGRRQGARHAT